MRVSSTITAWSNENKSCMRVDKREFTWEFCQLSLLDQTRTRVAWKLTSESLHESFVNNHCLIKREQELHENWTSESLHDSFVSYHCLIKREQELNESWQVRAYMRVLSTIISWSNESRSCMRDTSIFNAWWNENTSCMRFNKREYTSVAKPAGLFTPAKLIFWCSLTVKTMNF